MSAHPDQFFLDAIRKGDPEGLSHLFQEAYPGIERWICRNGGNRQDAQDVFADALETIFRKLQHGERVELTARLSTFVFSICRHLWLKILRRKKLDSRVRTDNLEVYSQEQKDWHSLAEEVEKMRFLRKKLEELSDSCKRLLQLCWQPEKLSMEEIASMMGFASANYASKRKHECIDILKNRVIIDPGFKDFK